MMADKKNVTHKTEVQKKVHPAKASGVPHKKLVAVAAPQPKAATKAKPVKPSEKGSVKAVVEDISKTVTRTKRVKPSEKGPAAVVVVETTAAVPYVKHVPKVKAPKKRKKAVDEEGREGDLDLEEEQESSHEEGPAAEPPSPRS